MFPHSNATKQNRRSFRAFGGQFLYKGRCHQRPNIKCQKFILMRLSPAYQRWWKFNNFYSEISNKNPENRKTTTRKFNRKKQSIKLSEKSLFPVKTCFIEQYFSMLFFFVSRIFNEKVIWSIYFKLVRLFTQIVFYFLSKKIHSKEFSLPNLNTFSDKINCWQFFSSFFPSSSVLKARVKGECEKNLENVNAETK